VRALLERFLDETGVWCRRTSLLLDELIRRELVEFIDALPGTTVAEALAANARNGAPA